MLPERVRVHIEVSRGDRLKRRADGGWSYLSPWPCPFNYGEIPGRPGADGDLLDAVVLGPALPRGSVVEVAVFGVVGFVDAGLPDDKLVCGPAIPSEADWERVSAFFARFAAVKAAWNRVRGRPGPTRLTGLTRRG